MTQMRIRDVDLFVEVVGDGYPLLLMHGGPGTDHWTMMPFKDLADQFRVILYDHRCNGRSDGPPVTSMTWDNLTADADALRESLGIEKWAVVGHSFGGNVALEYALRYPDRLSHMVLVNTGPDGHWPLQRAAKVAAERGYSPEVVELIRRWFNGEFEPGEMFSIFRRIGDVYQYHPSLLSLVRPLLGGAWQSKFRGEALVFAGQHLLRDWSVVDRLGEIDVPTLVIAGSYDFVFPPECQHQLAAGIPGARLVLIDEAGHSPHMEQQDKVMAEVRDFLTAPTVGAREPVSAGQASMR
jgi:proline iminopeptidase